MERPVSDRWPVRFRWRVAAVAGLCLAGLAVGAAVLQSTTSHLPTRSGVPFIAPALVAPSIVEKLDLPRFGSTPGATLTAVTDGDLPALNQPLLVVQTLTGARLVVHSLGFDSIPLEKGSRPYVLPDTTVQGTPDLGPAGRTWFDTGAFGGGEALVAARQLFDGNLRVTVLALRQGLPRLRAAVVPAPPPKGTRTVAVATWDPPTPDIFVLDRGGGRVPVVVRIYSGESGFRKLLLAIALPIVEPDQRRSLLEVARVQDGRRPDIILIKRRGPLGKPEAHFLSGDASFSSFDQHLAVPAPPISTGGQVVIGTRVGQVTAYVVILAGPTGTVSLMTLPYRAGVPS